MGRKGRDVVSMGTQSPTQQPAVRRDIADGPEYEIARPGKQHKNQQFKGYPDYIGRKSIY